MGVGTGQGESSSHTGAMELRMERRGRRTGGDPQTHWRGNERELTKCVAVADEDVCDSSPVRDCWCPGSGFSARAWPTAPLWVAKCTVWQDCRASFRVRDSASQDHRRLSRPGLDLISQGQRAQNREPRPLRAQISGGGQLTGQGQPPPAQRGPPGAPGAVCRTPAVGYSA